VRTALTGGGSDALDGIPYNDCNDGDFTITIVGGKVYIHEFDASSTDSEVVPQVIAPDDVGSNLGRWILKAATDETHDLEGAVSLAGSEEKTITIATNVSISDDLTVPSNITLKFIYPGKITIPSGKTLTINGVIEAGLWQIFDGDGSVSFGEGTVKEVYPEWFGAIADNNTDCSSAFSKANDSIKTNGGKIKLSIGIYVLNSSFTPSSRVSLEGEGEDASILRAGNNINLISIYNASGVTQNVHIRRLRLTGGSTVGRQPNEASSKVGSKGIYIRNVRWISIENVLIDNFSDYGIEFYRADTSELGYGISLYRVQINYCDKWGITSHNSNNHIFIDASDCEIRWCGQGAINGYWKGTWKGGHIGGNKGPAFRMVSSSTGSQYSEIFSIIGTTMENNGIPPDENGGVGDSNGQIYIYAPSGAYAIQNIQIIGVSISVSNSQTSQPGNDQHYGIRLEAGDAAGIEGIVIVGCQISAGSNVNASFIGIKIHNNVRRGFVISNRFEGFSGSQVDISGLGADGREANIVFDQYGKLVSYLPVGAEGESYPKMRLKNNTIEFGDGSSATDVSLSRSGTKTLQISGKIVPSSIPTFADGDTTPSVADSDTFKTNNSAATSITTFDDGKTGQKITIIFGDSNTTIVHGSGIILNGGTNVTPSANNVMGFVYDGANWYETSRNF